MFYRTLQFNFKTLSIIVAIAIYSMSSQVIVIAIVIVKK